MILNLLHSFHIINDLLVPTDPQPPDVTNNSVTQSRRYTPADRVNRYSRDSRQSSSDDGMGTVSSSGRWKVSAKIQQLLNTLKRPKRRPLPEFYEDDDVELEIAANPKDPNAPRPEGAYMSPALGEPLSVSRNLNYILNIKMKIIKIKKI